MAIENRKQYVITQLSRWQFYNALEELTAHPPTDPSLDPIFPSVYRQAVIIQIYDLEAELQDYEARHGAWVLEDPDFAPSRSL